MPKAITMEMLEAMSPDQRKTLHQNALARETPAAKAVIELLTQGAFVSVPAAAKAKTTKARAPKKAATTATAKHGRQS